MAIVQVTPVKPEYLTPINLTTGGTAFTGDGIEIVNNGRCAAILRNTGAGPNTVTIAADQTKVEGFSVSDYDIVIANGEQEYVKFGNVIPGLQAVMTVTGTPAEVEYIILDLA